MHAKTVWDVLWAGFLIYSGVIIEAAYVNQQSMRLYRRICLSITGLGWVCWGIGSLTLRRSDLWPFYSVASLSMVIGSGMFEGIKLSRLLHPRSSDRGSPPGPESGTKD